MTPVRNFRASIRAKLLALAFGCILAALFAEAVLRIHNPFRMEIRPANLRLLKNRVDTYHFTTRALDDRVVVRRNSLGFRGPEPPSRFSDSLTILTMGGSTTECQYQNEDKTWPAHLAKDLSADYRSVWLNNAGIAGHSTYGHIYVLNNFILGVRPKVLIFLPGWNDIGLDSALPADNKALQTMRFGSPSDLVYSLAQHSELFACLYAVAHSLRHPEPGAWRAMDPSFQLLPAQYLPLPEAEIQRVKQLHLDRYIPAYRARLATIVKLCRQHGIEPVFLTQPYLFGGGKDDVTGVDLGLLRTGPASNGRLEWEVAELYNDGVRALQHEQQILVIDLATTMPKSSRYFFDEGHFSNAGTELVARLIYPALTEWLAERFPGHSRAERKSRVSGEGPSADRRYRPR